MLKAAEENMTTRSSMSNASDCQGIIIKILDHALYCTVYLFIALQYKS